MFQRIGRVKTGLSVSVCSTRWFRPTGRTWRRTPRVQQPRLRRRPRKTDLALQGHHMPLLRRRCAGPLNLPRCLAARYPRWDQAPRDAPRGLLRDFGRTRCETRCVGIWNVSPVFYIVLFRLLVARTKKRRAPHHFYSVFNSRILVIRSRVWCKCFSIKKCLVRSCAVVGRSRQPV